MWRGLARPSACSVPALRLPVFLQREPFGPWVSASSSDCSSLSDPPMECGPYLIRSRDIQLRHPQLAAQPGRPRMNQKSTDFRRAKGIMWANLFTENGLYVAIKGSWKNVPAQFGIVMLSRKLGVRPIKIGPDSYLRGLPHIANRGKF